MPVGFGAEIEPEALRARAVHRLHVRIVQVVTLLLVFLVGVLGTIKACTNEAPTAAQRLEFKQEYYNRVLPLKVVGTEAQADQWALFACGNLAEDPGAFIEMERGVRAGFAYSFKDQAKAENISATDEELEEMFEALRQAYCPETPKPRYL